MDGVRPGFAFLPLFLNVKNHQSIIKLRLHGLNFGCLALVFSLGLSIATVFNIPSKSLPHIYVSIYPIARAFRRSARITSIENQQR